MGKKRKLWIPLGNFVARSEIKGCDFLLTIDKEIPENDVGGGKKNFLNWSYSSRHPAVR